MKIDGVQITGPIFRAYKEILTPEAIRFAANIARNFQARRDELLKNRQVRWAEIKEGKLPTFLQDQKSLDIRNSDWTVAPIKPDLECRFVEITGPASNRKMFINALNCADCYMTDSEDSESPTWENIINGQINIRDAVNGTITYTSPEGKHYKPKDKTATLMYRPRGWHLPEKHVLVDGKPISASLFDFGLMIHHNAKKLVEKGKTPAFYLPKMESHEEAELWRDVFNFSEEGLGIPPGTIRATVLIETILAAFEMDEMLYALKDYSAGLNAGRWDYAFSFVKKLINNPDFVMPDGSQVTMDKHFMKSYVDLLVQTCHKRGIHAMGGMSALIPRNDDKEGNDIAIAKVVKDKEREVAQGCDGAWVAHPGLVKPVREVFAKNIKGPHQIYTVKREDVKVTAVDLLTVPKGEITEKGLRQNIRDIIEYDANWLSGNGCVAINFMMDDLATVEGKRSLISQWIEHKAKLNDGRVITWDLVEGFLKEEVDDFQKSLAASKLDPKSIELSVQLFRKLINRRDFPEFISLEAYDDITTIKQEPKAETKEEFVAKVEKDWKENPRWEGIKRPYSAKYIWGLRGSEPNDYSDANKQARKAWSIVKRGPVATIGLVSGHDAVQMLASAAGIDSNNEAGLSFFDILYVGGWQSAAEKNSDKKTFSDLLFYGASTVPDNGKEVGNVLDMLDKIFHLKKDNKIQWKVPIIADADTGFGDKKTAGVHMERFIEANVAGVHFEDQVDKRCGHLAGKTLMTTKQFEQILEGAMEMRDIKGAETILIARTDAEAAKYIVNDSDERDKQFIDYSKGRTEKGYYHLKEGVGLEMAIQRGLAAAPYADMIWFETHEPDLEQALKFAEAIHKVHPGKMLAYNLSPSFSWDAYFTKKVLSQMGLKEKDLEDAIVKEKVDAEVFRQASEFIEKLGEAGYVFNFQTYATFRIKNLAVFNYSRQFKQEGMAAWIKFERAEKEAAKHGYFGQKGQSLVGGDYWEEFSGESIVTGSTEEQFRR